MVHTDPFEGAKRYTISWAWPWTWHKMQCLETHEVLHQTSPCNLDLAVSLRLDTMWKGPAVCAICNGHNVRTQCSQRMKGDGDRGRVRDLSLSVDGVTYEGVSTTLTELYIPHFNRFNEMAVVPGWRFQTPNPLAYEHRRGDWRGSHLINTRLSLLCGCFTSRASFSKSTPVHVSTPLQLQTR